jgi:hypothetical protein
MIRQLLACVKVNYIFYRRNSLLVVVALLLVGGLILMALPSVFLEGAAKKFDAVRKILESLNTFLYLFTALIALVTVFQHLRDRSLKMVITKPCPISVWMLANFAGALLLMAALYTIVYLVAGILFWAWHVPFQSGLVYEWLYAVCRAAILFSYLTLLTTLVHPVIAGMIAVFLREGTFYYTYLLVAGIYPHVDHPMLKTVLRALKPALYAGYMVAPIYSPYEKEAQAVASSLRIQPGDLAGLGYTVLYTFVFAAFCYALSTILLQRRRLI